jgi:hypothetical protein
MRLTQAELDELVALIVAAVIEALRARGLLDKQRIH